jgi:hypothetical protein
MISLIYFAKKEEKKISLLSSLSLVFGGGQFLVRSDQEELILEVGAAENPLPFRLCSFHV